MGLLRWAACPNGLGVRMARAKFKRGGSTSFLMLEGWMLDCDAWKSLKTGPRALYLELKRTFKGGNNGQLFLSHRDAGKLLNVGRDTVSKYFEALEDRGFIVQTRGHCLGPSGVGQAATYALTELSLNGSAATKEFMAWKKQNPRRNIQHSLAGKSNTPCRKTPHAPIQMLENPTALGAKQASTVLENPAIYTSNHIPNVGTARHVAKKPKGEVIEFSRRFDSKAKTG